MPVKKAPISAAKDDDAFWVREYIEHRESAYQARPYRFVRELSDAKLASELIFNNFASLSVPGGATHRDAVQQLAAGSFKPFQIETLPEFFNSERFIRGHSYFGHVWKQLDELARNSDDMHWWYSDRGLGMALLEPRELAAKIRLRQLTPFDRLAGHLFTEGMQDGRVAEEIVIEIAQVLDTQGFKLKESLSRSEWAPIAEFNQKYARRAVANFEGAFRVEPRSIRHRLSRAKARYEKALKA